MGAVLFLLDLMTRCQIVARCADRLERAAKHWVNVEQGIDDGQVAPPLDIIVDCTVCLSSMAAIRRILRPKDGSKPAVKRRSSALLKLLGEPAIPNLVVAIEVRNSWEHIDERLDDILRTRQRGSVEPTIYISSTPPDSNAIVLRRFDPIGFAIHFGDDVIALRPCIEEVSQLLKLVDGAFVQLRSEIIDVT